jgi:molybdopterin-binding protein
MKLSARNQLAARVTGTTAGPATTIVALELGGQRLVASITTEAAQGSGSPKAPRSSRSSRRQT